MSIETIPVTDEQSWLENRLLDVTSTEVSALYGLSPYMSEFELFHQKKDAQVVRLEVNERMKWGTRLEDIIAHGAAEDNGWNIEKMDVYMRDPAGRIGSSFDYRIIDAKGDGILEIKNVDSLVYRNKWIEDGDRIEAPEHIELQIQHQMEVADMDWCVLVALVGGNTQKVIRRTRDRAIGKDIRERVAAFWEAIDKNTPPSPDYTQDADYIIKNLHQNADADVVIEASQELEDLIANYVFTSNEAKDMEKIAKQYKAQIMDMIGTASKVISTRGNISCGMTKPSEGKLITPDMVGTYIGARSGFRNFRFTPKKEK